MSRPPASIRFRAANSGTRWRTWPADGLTILVATPYLDEAERCHRVALMHLGEIRQIGTPAEFRASLHAKRMELRTPDLRKALQARCRRRRAQEADVFDVQRFGDRLDLLVARRPKRRSGKSKSVMRAEGIAIDDIRIDEPTLENTFVATLRALGQEMHRTRRFPGGTTIASQRGQIAIGASTSPNSSARSPR